jgi:hypothetical protein
VQLKQTVTGHLLTRTGRPDTMLSMSNPRPPRPGREPFRLLTTNRREPLPTVEPVVSWPSGDTGDDVDETIDDIEPMTTDDRLDGLDSRLGDLETKQDLTRKEVAMLNVTMTAVAGRLDGALGKSKMSGATTAIAGTSTVGLLISVVVDNQTSILALVRAIRTWWGH